MIQSSELTTGRKKVHPSSSNAQDKCAHSELEILRISAPKCSLNFCVLWKFLLGVSRAAAPQSQALENMFECSYRASDCICFLCFHNKLLLLCFSGSTLCIQVLIWHLRETIPQLHKLLHIYPSSRPFFSAVAFVSQADKRIRANWTWAAGSRLK